jgi:hypothetical protein
MPDQEPDPRWLWVITAAQLQRMTFPEEPARARAIDNRDWWLSGDERWKAA